VAIPSRRLSSAFDHPPGREDTSSRISSARSREFVIFIKNQT